MLVVRLRGLPFNSDSSQVVEFLQNACVGDNVHFVKDMNPHATKVHIGECFVDVEDEKIDTVMACHRRHMGTRYIEVLRSDHEEVSKYLSRLTAHNAGGHLADLSGARRSEDPAAEVGRTLTINGLTINVDTVIRARGCPFESNEDEIAEPFKDYGVDGGRVLLDIVMSGPRCGKSSGQCFLVLDNREMRDAALEALQRCLVGNRYLELFAGNESDVNLIEKLATGEIQKTLESANEQKPCIRLRGLPFNVNQQDISNWFEPEYAVTNLSVEICYERGRPNGEAFVYIDEADLCERAIKEKHMSNMGSRYIEVFKSDDRCRTHVRGGDAPTRGAAGAGGAAGGRSGEFASSSSEWCYVKLRGVPYNASKRDVAEFFFGFEVQETDCVIEENLQGKPSGLAYVRLKGSQTVDKAIRELNRQHLGGRYIELFECSADEALGYKKPGRDNGPYSGGKGRGKGSYY